MNSPQLLRAVCSIPFSRQGNGVLWFMYTLAGLYLLVPILARWLNRATECEVRFYLLLWGISLLYPTLSQFLQVNETNTGILYYFTGYAGYFLLGWYLQNYGCPLRLRHLLPVYALCIAAPVVVNGLHWDVDTGEMFGYLSIFVALQCLTWWKVVSVLTSRLSVGEKTMARLAVFSNLSFGIYLSHIFLMRNVVWNWGWIKAIAFQPLQIATIFVLTLVFSTALSGFFSRTPMGDAVVGWRRK